MYSMVFRKMADLFILASSPATMFFNSMILKANMLLGQQRLLKGKWYDTENCCWKIKFLRPAWRQKENCTWNFFAQLTCDHEDSNQPTLKITGQKPLLVQCSQYKYKAEMIIGTADEKASKMSPIIYGRSIPLLNRIVTRLANTL